MLCLLSMALITSCHRPFDNKTNVLKVDTLQRLVNIIDQTLVLNEDTITKRNDSMTIKLSMIRSLYKDTTDGEIKAAIIRYAGIQAIYIDFLKNYPIMEMDEESHKKQVAQIKDQVLAQKISQEAFDKVFSQEKAQLAALNQKAKTITYNTITVEEDYLRNDPTITHLYKKLKNNR